MGAHPRLSTDRIRESVEKWRGSLQAASKDLGIARNNLYKRVARIGLDLEARRSGQPSVKDPALPILGAVRKRLLMVVRLTPTQRQRLREARWDLQARFRVELNDELILGQFFDEAFAEWLRGKLEAGTA